MVYVDIFHGASEEVKEQVLKRNAYAHHLRM